MTGEFKVGKNLRYIYENYSSPITVKDEDKVSVPVSHPAKIHVTKKPTTTTKKPKPKPKEQPTNQP